MVLLSYRLHRYLDQNSVCKNVLVEVATLASGSCKSFDNRGKSVLYHELVCGLRRVSECHLSLVDLNQESLYYKQVTLASLTCLTISVLRDLRVMPAE